MSSISTLGAMDVDSIIKREQHRFFWRLFVDRSIVGSDIVIAIAIFKHLYEGLLFLTVTPNDGWSIGMAMLLESACNSPVIAGLALFFVAGLAISGNWIVGLSRKQRWVCLLPQLILLSITSMAAIGAIVTQSYANGIHESWAFISSDQVDRVFSPIAYACCIWARIRRI